jgi:hypothetical protein
VILQQTAGIAMDRENVGGNMSGQQSSYVSRGGMTFNNKLLDSTASTSPTWRRPAVTDVLRLRRFEETDGQHRRRRRHAADRRASASTW